MDFQNIIQNILPWLFDHGVKIIFIVAISYFIRRSIGVFIKRFIEGIVVSDHFLSKEAEKKREDTLIRIFSNTINILILIIALLMILQEFGLDIGPLIAAAGV
ncbi:MAG: mechanosensitive ion channel family protein, partial [Candidatus Pacebacteria bacterium]|nr:mechanosensitive ion channel family protein [Candidatus Paceibacterota bacterium]